METIPCLHRDLHPLTRLRICVALAERGALDMADLSRLLGLSKSALSKQVAGLVELGLLARGRVVDDGRRVRLELTHQGHRALVAHLGALAVLAARVEGAGFTVDRPGVGRPANNFFSGNSCHLGNHE